MSYRVYVNDVQLFGNNESYPEWDDYIRSQDIAIGPEGQYDGEVTDFMALLEVTERIVMRLEQERREKYDRVIMSIARNPEVSLDKALESVKIITGTNSLFNLQAIPENVTSQKDDDYFRTSLFDELWESVMNYYAFMPYALFRICEKDLKPAKNFGRDGHFRCYKLKPGRTIRVHAG